MRRPWRAPGDALRELAHLGAGALGGAVSRGVQRSARHGRHGAPITTGPDRTVLLFFEDVEADRLVRGDRHLARGARRAYHAMTLGQRASGFEVAFRRLCLALERAGCRVVVNNAALARRHPTHPVGLCGYPHLLDRWSLPNPAVLGPGLYDHPGAAPHLLDDPRFRSYLVPSGWMRDLFVPYYGGERVRLWFGGVDVAEWPDGRDHAKDIDLLVYEKFLWSDDGYGDVLIEPVRAELARRGLRVHVLRRGTYDGAGYRALLARSRAMLFLCEHETQGLAYQEALASNVPVLAWDNGLWLDPARVRYTTEPVSASSVPHFGAACGERFRNADEFPAVLDRFLGRLTTYEPRRFVGERLSLERSAALYLDAYVAAGG